MYLDDNIFVDLGALMQTKYGQIALLCSGLSFFKQTIFGTMEETNVWSRDLMNRFFWIDFFVALKIYL